MTKDQEKEDTRFADSVKRKAEGSGSIVGNLKKGSVSLQRYDNGGIQAVYLQ